VAGLPVGVQIIERQYYDLTCLHMAGLIEEGYYRFRPPPGIDVGGGEFRHPRLGVIEGALRTLAEPEAALQEAVEYQPELALATPGQQLTRPLPFSPPRQPFPDAARQQRLAATPR